MQYANNADVETLLRREARDGLPLGHLLRIYLDPFALFKNASTGTAWVRAQALRYNRAMRWMLLRYLWRWLAIGLTLFFAMAPIEPLAAELPWITLPVVAACALGSCVAVTTIFCTLATYVLLGKGD
jgi:hypothetical protein